MNLNDAMNVAINIPSGTPPYYAACAICQLRMIDPHGASMVAPVANWQVVVMEQILCNAIVELVRA